MHRKVIGIFAMILFVMIVNGQVPEKIWFNKNDSIYGYYVVIKPSGPRIQGALILLDGFGGNADGFLSETKFFNVTFSNDMITVCIPTGRRLYADDSIIALINRVSSSLLHDYSLSKNKFAIGGMSSGGTIALRYAELCKEDPSRFPVQPSAVFCIDSPVDLIGLYRSSERELKKKHSGWWLYESQMIIDSLKLHLGDINGDIKKYNNVSPFSLEDTTAGNEKFLKDVAVRTYHDVDISWHIQNRKRSLYETNMLNASELINRLVLLGNTNAEFVTSRIPGRRSNGERHPHSWNIVDEIDAVQWIKEKLHFYPDHLESQYTYSAPVGWEPETIIFPIDFAPLLPYIGFEELRFAPGWGRPSGEKWAYTILWWLDDSYPFNEQTLKENLESYFSGLTRRRAIADGLDLKEYFPAKAQVTKIKTIKGDKESYSATVNIFDAQVTRKPGSLYIKIHLKDCQDRSKTIVLFEIAGNTFSNPVWQQLDKINEDYRCGK
jgi:hypothetical protein